METKYMFLAYEDEEHYNNKDHFFKKTFNNHTKLKVFSVDHSYENVKIYPNYVSTYIRIEKN